MQSTIIFFTGNKTPEQIILEEKLGIQFYKNEKPLYHRIISLEMKTVCPSLQPIITGETIDYYMITDLYLLIKDKGNVASTSLVIIYEDSQFEEVVQITPVSILNLDKILQMFIRNNSTHTCCGLNPELIKWENAVYDFFICVNASWKTNNFRPIRHLIEHDLQIDTKKRCHHCLSMSLQNKTSYQIFSPCTIELHIPASECISQENKYQLCYQCEGKEILDFKQFSYDDIDTSNMDYDNDDDDIEIPDLNSELLEIIINESYDYLRLSKEQKEEQYNNNLDRLRI